MAEIASVSSRSISRRVGGPVQRTGSSPSAPRPGPHSNVLRRDRSVVAFELREPIVHSCEMTRLGQIGRRRVVDRRGHAAGASHAPQLLKLLGVQRERHLLPGHGRMEVHEQHHVGRHVGSTRSDLRHEAWAALERNGSVAASRATMRRGLTSSTTRARRDQPPNPTVVACQLRSTTTLTSSGRRCRPSIQEWSGTWRVMRPDSHPVSAPHRALAAAS